MMPSWFATPVVESLLFVLSALEHEGFTCTAHRGLLLGALRLGGLLPWDDDSDVFLVDADPAGVEQRIGPLLEEHGFRLRFREHEHYYFVFPRTLFPVPLSGLTEVGFFTRTEDRNGVQFDVHDPRRRLSKDELFPLQRLPFHGSYVMGPAQAGVAMERMYGDLASPAAMNRFRAPQIAREAQDFWGAARPIDGPLDWPRISRRFMERRRSPSFHIWQLPCSAWHMVNRGHWVATDMLRAMAGGES
jgi:hypothetical protein